MEITRHKIFKEANIQSSWLDTFNKNYHCDGPESHLSHLTLYGGKYNGGVAANIWYIDSCIDLYDITILDKIKEFTKLFGYKNIEIYESE